VKSAGVAGDDPHGWTTLAFTVTPGPVATLSVDRTSPQVVETSITVTASASAGIPPYQYRFWVWDGMAWTMVRDWGAGNPYTWTPVTAGTYQLGVWAKPSATPGDLWAAYATLPFTVTAPPAPSLTSFTASPASPQVIGTPITVSAVASGGLAPYQYKW
jgi:hypothetical protein